MNISFSNLISVSAVVLNKTASMGRLLVGLLGFVCLVLICAAMGAENALKPARVNGLVSTEWGTVPGGSGIVPLG